MLLLYIYLRMYRTDPFERRLAIPLTWSDLEGSHPTGWEVSRQRERETQRLSLSHLPICPIPLTSLPVGRNFCSVFGCVSTSSLIKWCAFSLNSERFRNHFPIFYFLPDSRHSAAISIHWRHSLTLSPAPLPCPSGLPSTPSPLNNNRQTLVLSICLSFFFFANL